MNHKKKANELVATFINGNRSDLVDALREMDPLDAALVSLHIGAGFLPKDVSDVIKAIEARR